MQLINGLIAIITATKKACKYLSGNLQKLKNTALITYKRNKVLGSILIGAWLLSGIVVGTIIFIIAGPAGLLAYIICKFSGMCPL